MGLRTRSSAPETRLEANGRIEQVWERIVTFYDYPRKHWKAPAHHNDVESPFASVRLRTTAAKRVRREENAATSS
jgi:transposase-like protein